MAFKLRFLKDEINKWTKKEQLKEEKRMNNIIQEIEDTHDLADQKIVNPNQKEPMPANISMEGMRRTIVYL